MSHPIIFPEVRVDQVANVAMSIDRVSSSSIPREIKANYSSENIHESILQARLRKTKVVLYIKPYNKKGKKFK